MSVKRAVKCYSCLRMLAKTKSSLKKKKIISNSPKSIYPVITDIAKQILKGTIPLKPKDKANLKRYKNHLRLLTSKSTLAQRKKIINQKGGFLPLLIKPALTLLATVAANKLSK